MRIDLRSKLCAILDSVFPKNRVSLTPELADEVFGRAVVVGKIPGGEAGIVVAAHRGKRGGRVVPLWCETCHAIAREHPATATRQIRVDQRAGLDAA